MDRPLPSYHQRVRERLQPRDAQPVFRVLRISHSSVVTPWRERDRALRRRGVEIVLLTAERWNEGGSLVAFDSAGDGFVHPVRTFGSHPNLFVFDPVPLWRLLKGHHFDLIDAHEEPYSLVVAETLVLMLLRRIRTPFIIASAQNLPKIYPIPFRWFERWALRKARGAYVCNTAAGERLRRAGFSGELTLLPLGVDVEQYHPQDRLAPSEYLRVGYVGRLTYEKGVAVLLTALAHDVRLHAVIVGSGPEEDELIDLADRLGVNDRVTFIGHVDSERLSDVYRQFDVLAVPSIPRKGWIEQFGRVAVEAQAAGVPVVASAVGSLPDVIGSAGLLVPPMDPDALATALTRFLDEPGLWEELRAAALTSVKKFTWEAIADEHLELYRAILLGGADGHI